MNRISWFLCRLTKACECACGAMHACRHSSMPTKIVLWIILFRCALSDVQWRRHKIQSNRSFQSANDTLRFWWMFTYVLHCSLINEWMIEWMNEQFPLIALTTLMHRVHQLRKKDSFNCLTSFRMTISDAPCHTHVFLCIKRKNA